MWGGGRQRRDSNDAILMVIEIILGVGRVRQVNEKRLRREWPIDTRYMYVG